MNVAKGDMAIIVESLQGTNNGRIVKVLDFVGDKHVSLFGVLRNMWRVEMIGAPAKEMLGDMVMQGYVEDHRLRRISGLKDEDVVDQEEEIAA